MLEEPKTIHVEEGSPLAEVLNEADRFPLLLEKGGVTYRIIRANKPSLLPISDKETDEASYDPAKVVEAVDATAGSWSDLAADEVISHIYRAREEGSRPVDRP